MNFQKNKVAGSKIAFFVISQSFTHHFICLNPLSANPTNGQTHSKNSLSICWRIVWVSIAISWYWCFFLTLAFNRTIFYRNNVLSILVLSTKKGYSSFAKKSFVFQKSLCSGKNMIPYLKRSQPRAFSSVCSKLWIEVFSKILLISCFAQKTEVASTKQ